MSAINLGQVASIQVSLTAPSNLTILWYDNNVGEKKHKYYDTVASAWVTLAPAAGAATWGTIAGILSSQADLVNYITTQINTLKGSPPSALDTLQKIATAINNDAGFYTTISNAIASKAGSSDSRFPTSFEKAALVGTSGSPSGSNLYVTNSDTRLSNSRTPSAHKLTHEAGGSDPLTGNLDANARIKVLVEDVLVGIRRGINLFPGTGISFTVVDDNVDEEVEIIIESSGGGSYTDEEAQDAVGSILVDTNSIDATYNDGTPSITFAVRRKTTGLGADKIALSEDSSGIYLQGGTSANSAALGDDARFPTASEKAALVGDGSTPSGANPYATVNYVLNLLNGLRWKSPAKTATTANITLSGAQTIDSISVVAGDRVLVKNQTDQTQNGIYIVATGAWTRSLDADIAAELQAAAVLVEQGTINANLLYQQTTDNVTLGTSNIVWTGFGSAIYSTDGQGIEISGTVISLEIDGNSLSKSGSGIKVKLKSSSLSGTEGQILETADGLVVKLGTGANDAAPGNHTHNSDNITEGSTNLFFQGVRVLATSLTGLVAATGTIVSTDNILQAFDKVKYFIDNFNSTIRTITVAWTFSALVTFSNAINEAKWTDIASASTTDLGAANGNYGDITGTVTITSLGIIAAGARRIATFTNILIITHNATSLRLPTGANITTAAGDTAIFISLGSGNWKCVAYTRADGTALVGGSSSTTIQTLTDAANISWNGASGQNAKVTLGGNRTLDAITSPINGIRYHLTVYQDGTGNRTLAFNAAYKFPDTTAAFLNSTASHFTNFEFEYDGTNFNLVSDPIPSMPSLSVAVNPTNATAGRQFMQATVAERILARTASNTLAWVQATTNMLLDLCVSTAKIAANAVTNAKLAQMAANTVKANLTGSIADPTDASVIDIYDSNQKAYKYDLDGLTQILVGCIYTQISSVTVANTVTETTLLGATVNTHYVGSKTIPANTLVVGKTIRINLDGIITDDVVPPTLRVRVKLGSVTIMDTAATALLAITSNGQFEIICEVCVRTIGATGTVFTQGSFGYNSGIATFNRIQGLNTTTSTIDTTISNDINVTVEWGTADSDNSIICTNAIIEILN